MNIIEKPNVAVTIPATLIMTAKKAFPFDKKDGKTLFMVENDSTAAINLVIEGGDGLQATGSWTIPVPIDARICFTLESGKFKKLYGENKGCVVMTGVGLKVSTYLLP